MLQRSAAERRETYTFSLDLGLLNAAIIAISILKTQLHFAQH